MAAGLAAGWWLTEALRVCRGWYSARLCDAGRALVTFWVARSGKLSRAVAARMAEGADAVRLCRCGAAASAPATATAGAATPARLATFRTGEGALCRPRLLIFGVLVPGVAGVTNLPHAGAAPGYAALLRLSPGLTLAHRAVWPDIHPKVA